MIGVRDEVIVGIIKPFELDDVKEAVKDLGVQSLTVPDVQGFGRQRGHTKVYRGAPRLPDTAPTGESGSDAR
jgi:nitrogen regulatory protein P-II 1